MSYADDFWGFTNGTGTASAIGGPWKYYDRRFLERVNKLLPLLKLGQVRPLPEGNGTTVQMHRWLNAAASVSGALLTEGQLPSAIAVKGQTLSVSIAEYGAYTQISSLLSQTHIDERVSGVVDIMAEHAARVRDTECHQIVCSNGLYPLRADYAVDTGATFAGVIDSSTSTTFVDVALSTNTDYGDANDDLNQSIVIITSGVAYGQARVVTDFVTSGGTATVSPAWDVNPVAGDTYVVTTADGIVASDKLTYENIKKARTILKKNEAKPVDGKYFVCVITPDQASGLMDDAKWIAAHTYQDTSNLYDGEIGRLGGVRFIEETNGFAFPIAARGTAGTSSGPGANGANYTETGAVHTAIMLGKECFGVTAFQRKKGQAQRPTVIVKSAEQLAQPIPRFSTVGWMLEWATKGLNPMFGVGIWTGE